MIKGQRNANTIENLSNVTVTYTTSQYKHNALGFLRMTVTKNIVTPTLTLYTAPIISNIFNNLPEAMKQQADTVLRFASRMFCAL